MVVRPMRPIFYITMVLTRSQRSQDLRPGYHQGMRTRSPKNLCSSVLWVLMPIFCTWILLLQPRRRVVLLTLQVSQMISMEIPDMEIQDMPGPAQHRISAPMKEILPGLIFYPLQ